MKQNGLRIASLALSIVIVIKILFINHEIALRYIHADGKTQAFFGLVEYFSYSFKFYFLVPAILSLLLEVIAIKRTGLKPVDYFILILSVLTMVLIFAPIWRLMTSQ